MNIDTIKAQYRVLGDLRRLDEKAYRVAIDVERIPQDIAKLEATLATRKATLDKDRATFEGTEKGLRAAEMTLKEREDSLKKAESKMMEVKTNEEYQAALKENQVQKDAKGKLEEETIGMLSAIDEKRSSFKSLEKEFAEFQAKVQAEKKELETVRAKLVVELAEHEAKRAILKKQLEAPIATIYTRMAPRFKGVVVVGTNNEICLGCNMRVPPQMYNEIIGFKKVHACPNCLHILIPLTAETEALTGS